MKVTIISGKKNSAKTTTLKNIVDKSNNAYLGYICESDENKKKFYLKNVFNGEKITIMQSEYLNTKESIGKYYIIDNSFLLAENKLLSQIINLQLKSFTIVIDEVGALELKGSGYNNLIEKIVKLDYDLIFCIRDIFVEAVIKKYNLKNVSIINV